MAPRIAADPTLTGSPPDSAEHSEDHVGNTFDGTDMSPEPVTDSSCASEAVFAKGELATKRYRPASDWIDGDLQLQGAKRREACPRLAGLLQTALMPARKYPTTNAVRPTC